MKVLVVLGAALWLAGGLATADEKLDPKAVGAGRALYLRHCAACHGGDGKGAGPAAGAMKAAVPDLTALPRKDGQFDADRVRTSIDGTQAASPHGSRDMPVWGKVFEKTGGKRGEGWAQTEIWTLVEYIASIQAPAAPEKK